MFELPATLEKWLMIVVIGACLFGFGFVRGCEYDRKDIKAADDKFILGSKQIIEVEKRVEVPKFIQTVTTIHTHSEALINEAKSDAPTPAVCEFGPERLSRLRRAATGDSQ